MKTLMTFDQRYPTAGRLKYMHSLLVWKRVFFFIISTETPIPEAVINSFGFTSCHLSKSTIDLALSLCLTLAFIYNTCVLDFDFLPSKILLRITEHTVILRFELR